MAPTHAATPAGTPPAVVFPLDPIRRESLPALQRHVARLGHRLAPGQAIPPHVHPWDEAIYVLTGEVSNRVGERTGTTPAGSLIFIPGGLVHGQFNPGTQSTKLLLILSPPAEAERLLAEIDGCSEPEVIAAMERYGMKFVQ